MKLYSTRTPKGIARLANLLITLTHVQAVVRIPEFS